MSTPVTLADVSRTRSYRRTRNWRTVRLPYDEGVTATTDDGGAMPPLRILPPTFLEIFEEAHAEFNQRFNTSFERRDTGGEPEPYPRTAEEDGMAAPR